ncbi:PKD domain-containing protein [Hymenobacter monticola]|uniref:PKD domain-containing protein n=1 Tax=Hymenobacter monticola TaxID=1705399 RepID=A0ABY4B8D7_9BACT|nr:PKD domain-containing protein [Hymenobacter monticola]UOE34562.1 PKD domain-containing protein [Hymenobacter monticola]
MKHILSLYGLLICLLATACSKSSDPAPAAAPAFTASRPVVEVDEELQFSNASTNAARYEWAFGDGQTSTQPNPKVRYAQSGTFTVTLTAFNTENKAATQKAVVTVGRRKLSGIRVVRMSFVTPAGQPWDTDGTGPDISFEFRGTSRAGSSVPFTTNVSLGTLYSDLTPASLPLNIDLTRTPVEFPLDGNFTFAMKEYNNAQLLIRTMVGATLLTTAPSADRNAQGSGTYTYESPDGAYQLVFSYITTP